MATLNDWEFLRDSLRSLDKKVVASEIVVMGPPWNLPAELTGNAAADYLEAANVRLKESAKAVEDALASPLARVQNAGKDVGSIVRNAAERAARIAKDLGHDSVEAFNETVDRMKTSAKELATGFGMGLGTIIIIGLLLWARNSRG